MDSKNKGVTLKDIASYAGVAVSTVSYVMNNDPRIPESTKAKVLKAARELGYCGESGRKHRPDFRRQMVLCLNTINGEIYTEIINSMKNILSANNCELLIYVGTTPSHINGIDGLFVLNSKVSNAEIENVTAKYIPVVLMDRDIPIKGTVSVTLDNFGGVYSTTVYAIDKGCKNFCFVGGPQSSFESNDRYEGFKHALDDKLINYKTPLVLQSDFTFNGGLNVSRYLLETSAIPDAIICANDETAMGIRSGLLTKKAARGILVTGFDGIVPSDTTHYVTAKADRSQWGAMASYLMQQFSEGKHKNARIKIPVEVLEFY